MLLKIIPVVVQTACSVFQEKCIVLIIVTTFTLPWWNGITSFVAMTPRDTRVCYHHYHQQSYDA